MSCPALIPPSAFACYVTVIMPLTVPTRLIQEQLYCCGALGLLCEMSAYFVTRMCEESLHIRYSRLQNDGFCYYLRTGYRFPLVAASNEIYKISRWSGG